MNKVIRNLLLASALSLPLVASSLTGITQIEPIQTVLVLDVFGGTVEYGPLPYQDWFSMGVIYVDFSTPHDDEKVVFFNQGWSICVMGISCPNGPVLPIPAFTPIFTTPPAETPEPATWLIMLTGAALVLFSKKLLTKHSK